MSINFDPLAYVRDVDQAARAEGWTVRYLTPMASGPRPWLHRAAQGRSDAPRIYLSAGIHGDEISGPIALLQMLREPDFFAFFDTTIFPILNPTGLARGVRVNADDITSGDD